MGPMFGLGFELMWPLVGVGFCLGCGLIMGVSVMKLVSSIVELACNILESILSSCGKLLLNLISKFTERRKKQ